MDAILNGTVVLLTVLYTLLLDAYARVFARRGERIRHLVRPLLLGTVALHLLSVLLRGAQLGACPVVSRWEASSLVAFFIALIYLILELRSGERSTGVFVVAGAFLLQLLSAVFLLGPAGDAADPPGAFSSLHAFSAIVGIAAVAVSGTYGLLYVFLYRAIKVGRFGLFFRRMPSLDTLGQLNQTATALGFLALTVAVGLGFWGMGTAGAGDGAAHRGFVALEVLLTITLWLLFGTSLLGRRFFRLGEVRQAFCSVVALALVAALIAGIFMRGFHS
ncbi:MAG: hypothetical protein ACE5GW_03020 [Planctomycetota bacterium]